MPDLTQRIYEEIHRLESRNVEAEAVVINPKSWVILEYEANERERNRKQPAVQRDPVRHRIESVFGLPVYIGEIEDEQILVCVKPKDASASWPCRLGCRASR